MKGTQFNRGTSKAWSAQTTPYGGLGPHNGIYLRGGGCPHGEAPAHNGDCVAPEGSHLTQPLQSRQSHPSPLAKNALYLRAAITKAKERYLWLLSSQNDLGGAL